MTNLSQKKCIPCSGEVPPLDANKKQEFLKELHHDWKLTHDGTRIERVFKFENFQKAMDLAVEIGKIAEDQGHHPELHVGFGHLDVEIWTHKIGDLVESDFIFAAKVDKLEQ